MSNSFADPDPRIAALHKVMARLEGDRPAVGREPDDRMAGFAEGLELAISRLNYHAHQLRQAEVDVEERDARRRGKVYAALTDQKLVRVGVLGGRRALDAPEMQDIAAIAVAALREAL